MSYQNQNYGLLFNNYCNLLIVLKPQLMIFQPQSSVPSDPSQDSFWSQVEPSNHFFLRQYLSTEHKLSASFRHILPKGAIYITQSVGKGSDTNSTIWFKDNLNVVLNLQGSSQLWTKFTDSQFKIHYDHGSLLPVKFLGNWHLYGSFSSTRKIKNSSFKLGGFNTFSNGVVDLRARYNVGEFRNEQYLYAKTLLNFSKLSFGFIGVFDLSRNFLQKNDVSLGLQLNDQHWIGAHLDCQGFRNYNMNFSRLDNYFDLAKVAYTYTSGKLKLGLGYQHSIQKNKTKKIEAAVQYETDSALKGIKVVANSLKQFGLAAHIKAQSIPQFTFGFSWPNLNTIAPSSAYLSVQLN